MDEISLSVEESNKLRISLGLKPLEIEKDDRVVRVNPKEAKQDNTPKPIGTNKILKKTKTLGEGKQESVQDFLKKVGRKKKNTTTITTGKKTITTDYNQDDLEGLKISHNLEDLPQESILTLRDHVIGDEDSQDELELFSLKKPQKKKTTIYDEYEREQMGMEKKLLEKYDEDDEEHGFVLGKGGNKLNTSRLEDMYEKIAKPGGISLDYKKTEMSDFHEVSFKKKKVKKMKRKKGGTDLEDIQEQKEYKQFENSNRQTDISSLNFVDDYDLQQSLARSRKKNVKQKSIDLDQVVSNEERDDNQVVISDLTEFVENLSSIPLLKQKDEENDDSKSPALLLKQEDDTKPVDTPRAEHSDVDMDVDMDVDQEEDQDQEQAEESEDEAPINKGLAGTLSLLSSRGDLQTPTTTTSSHFSKSREEILIEVQIKQDFEKYGSERDWPRRLKELESRRERARMKRLEGYKPNVALLHRDKTGRELTPKEAFRDFAQKFHGVKSGKNKVEKKLKRLKEELDMKKMDGGVAVRVTGQSLAREDKPVKMERGVIMELPVPGSKPVAVKRKHADIVEAVVAPQQSVTQSQPKQPTKPAVSPKRGKITFGFGKAKLAPKKLE